MYIPNIKVVDQTVQAWECSLTDGRADRRYKVHYLPASIRHAIDNYTCVQSTLLITLNIHPHSARSSTCYPTPSHSNVVSRWVVIERNSILAIMVIYVNIISCVMRSLSDLLGDLLIALFNFQWQIHEEMSAVCYTNLVLIPLSH